VKVLSRILATLGALVGLATGGIMVYSGAEILTSDDPVARDFFEWLAWLFLLLGSLFLMLGSLGMRALIKDCRQANKSHG